jgi:hypothetical protein
LPPRFLEIGSRGAGSARRPRCSGGAWSLRRSISSF